MPARRAALLALVLASPWHPGCSGDDLARFDDPFCARALADGPAFDAPDWLRTPSAVPRHLGTWTGEESLAFVHGLEAAGATRQAVCETKTTPGLVVGLPDDPGRRRAVFERFARGARALGHEPPADRKQRYLFLPLNP